MKILQGWGGAALKIATLNIKMANYMDKELIHGQMVLVDLMEIKLEIHGRKT